MKRRKWTSKEKTHIILEGLSGKIEIAKLCQKYEISQAQYYKWRDLFLQNAYQSFETKSVSRKEQNQDREIQQLRNIIGDLTIELKKSEYEL